MMLKINIPMQVTFFVIICMWMMLWLGLTAITSRNELISALSSAGLILRKWTSNSKEVLSDINSDDI